MKTRKAAASTPSTNGERARLRAMLADVQARNAKIASDADAAFTTMEAALHAIKREMMRLRIENDLLKKQVDTLPKEACLSSNIEKSDPMADLPKALEAFQKMIK